MRADDDATARLLIDRAVALADRLDVRYLELRHEQPIEHPALTDRMTSKVHMRLPLPGTAGRCGTGCPRRSATRSARGRRAA